MDRRAMAAFVACTVWLLAAAPGFAAEEDKVKEAFQAFQDAIKARDADKIWDLLDTSSREAAEKTAKTFKDAYAKAKDDKKKELEKRLGLTADQLAGLTGKTFLKSTRYHAKYHEVPGSTVEKVAVEDKKATVFYTEEDGDKEKLGLVNQDGKWKVVAAP
jgi:uncharacterized membrane protein YvbJ